MTSWLLVSIFCERIIGIAVKPTLAGFGGRDDRMAALVGVAARVPVRRRVAAARAAAHLARAQVHPSRAGLDTFFALARFRLLHVVDRRNVLTRILRGHARSSSDRLQPARLAPAS